MRIFRYFAFAASTLLTSQVHCQQPAGNDTVNRVDAQNRKQGTWVFYTQGGRERMRCTFADDTIASSRTFTLDSATLERQPAKNKQEHFALSNGSKTESGWFDTSTGEIHLEERTLALTIDTTIQYLMGIPALYAFGKKDLMDDIDKIASPLKKSFKDNKAVVEIMVDKNGTATSVTVKLSKPDRKLETILLPKLQQLDRWQPAFNTWRTQPYKKQIIINF